MYHHKTLSAQQDREHQDSSTWVNAVFFLCFCVGTDS
jgi:hypothetical protein